MSPDDPRHGTYAGARRHRVVGIPPCDACKMAAARYQNMREYDLLQGRPRAVSAIGARRRVQGLVHLGYSYRELGPHLGVSPAQVHKWATHDQAFIRATSLERIAAATATLGMTPAPQTRNAAYARTVAKRNQWVSLFAWDDIDNPNERPRASTKGEGDWDDQIDDAVVFRVVNEMRRPRKLTGAESAEVVRILLSRGLSTHVIANDYGIKVERYAILGDREAS